MFLRDFSEKELLDELARRAKRKIVPQPLPEPDYSTLREFIQKEMVAMAEGAEPMGNLESVVFELTMEAIYGDKVWDWWTEHK